MVAQWQGKRKHTVLLLITVYEVPVDCNFFVLSYKKILLQINTVDLNLKNVIFKIIPVRVCQFLVKFIELWRDCDWSASCDFF